MMRPLLLLLVSLLVLHAQDESCAAYKVPERPSATKHSLTSPRGPAMATRVWAPSNNNKPATALVLIVHGGGWHSGYFGPLAQTLNDVGVFVAAYDQVGLGYSESEPTARKGDYHVEQPIDVIDDLYAAIDWAKREVGREDLPLFLIAESAGAPIAVEAALRKGDRKLMRMDGVVLLGGLMRVGKGMLPPDFAVRILLFLAGFFPRTRMPATDTSTTFDEAFGDRKWAEIARSDPAVHVSVPVTLGGAAAIIGGGELVLKQAASLSTPLLAIHGKRDVRTQLSAVQELVDTCQNGEILVLDTNGHQLLQDVPAVTEAAMKKVASWIQSRISA